MLKLNHLLRKFSGALFIGAFLLTLSTSVYSTDEVYNTEQLDNVLNNYQNDTKQVEKDVNKLNIDNGTTITDLDDVKEESEEVGRYHRANVPPSRYSKSYQESVMKLGKGMGLNVQEKLILAFVPLQQLTDEHFDQVLSKVLQPELFEKLKKNYPKYIDLMKRVVRSDATLPSLISMVSDKDRLIYFSAAILFTFVFSFITKRFFYIPGDGFFKLIRGFILHCIVMAIIRMCVIYYFFAPELTPFIEIIQGWLALPT